MCGIAGYVGTHRPELLAPMCDVLAHRGPDDSGEWIDAEAGVGFGHRRLSIIDLSAAGHQPMSNADGSIWISFNGEIYNFPEHRERLEQSGYRFHSHTDTEVLIALVPGALGRGRPTKGTASDQVRFVIGKLNHLKS